MPTQYSSKDFDKTSAHFDEALPDRLIHKAVEQGFSADFSKERSHPVSIVDLPSRSMSMTLGSLAAKQGTREHRHSYETLIYVLRGKGFSNIGGKTVHWQAGDAIYVPVWVWHSHHNDHPTEHCQYIACENTPLLQNLGVAIREESCH